MYNEFIQYTHIRVSRKNTISLFLLFLQICSREWRKNRITPLLKLRYQLNLSSATATSFSVSSGVIRPRATLPVKPRGIVNFTTSTKKKRRGRRTFLYRELFAGFNENSRNSMLETRKYTAREAKVQWTMQPYRWNMLLLCALYCYAISRTLELIWCTYISKWYKLTVLLDVYVYVSMTLIIIRLLIKMAVTTRKNNSTGKIDVPITKASSNGDDSKIRILVEKAVFHFLVLLETKIQWSKIAKDTRRSISPIKRYRPWYTSFIYRMQHSKSWFELFSARKVDDFLGRITGRCITLIKARRAQLGFLSDTLSRRSLARSIRSEALLASTRTNS